jgi:hypothetical protein
MRRHPNWPRRPEPDSSVRSEDTDVTRVSATLRAEALRHTPDSAAMLARVEAAMGSEPLSDRAARPGSPRPWLRVAAAASVVLVIAAGGWFASGNLAPHRPRLSPLAAATPGTSPTVATSSGSGAGIDAHPAGTSSPSPVTASPASSFVLGSPGHTQIQQGFLSSDGSIDRYSITDWSQSDITLKNSRTVTALTVVLRLADTPGLSSTGAWSTVPVADMTISVRPGNGTLVYTFTLHAGITLAPGSYEFAGQYSHAVGGRNADNDTYVATASAGQASAEVYGNFAPDS